MYIRKDLGPSHLCREEGQSSGLARTCWNDRVGGSLFIQPQEDDYGM